ncbi:MAG: hypothetical protein U0002_17625 [Thermoanaerobaculia bacterium]
MACTAAVDVEGGTTAEVIGCGCRDDSGQQSGTGDWAWASGNGSVRARALPGIICQLNVGNISNGDFGVKIDTCAHLRGRAAEVSSAECDTITLIELMSKYQCAAACIPGEGTGPNTEACRLCKGCPPPEDPGPTSMVESCERQAALVCPSDQYQVFCSQAPPDSVGCDCICQKLGPCSTQGPNCHADTVRVDDITWMDTAGVEHPCDAGNYATCTSCTDPYGGPSMGHCVVHPSHCNGSFFGSEEDRALCLSTCSTLLAHRAAAKIRGLDYRSFSGDFNCTPHAVPCDGGGVSIGECPWLEDDDSFQGMELCSQNSGTAAVGAAGGGGGSEQLGGGFPNCMLDFVLSDHCGCGETYPVMNGIDYGDHRTVIFGATSRLLVQVVPGTSHRYVHGHYVVRGPDGNPTAPISYDHDDWSGATGSSCRASASCGYDSSRGFVLSQTDNCWSEHQARLKQPAECFQGGKALICSEAGAWAVTMGSSQSHGADTADTAVAGTSAGGNGQWSSDCDQRRHIVDVRRVSATEFLSDPFFMRANADSSCSAQTGGGGPVGVHDVNPE